MQPVSFWRLQSVVLNWRGVQTLHFGQKRFNPPGEKVPSVQAAHEGRRDFFFLDFHSPTSYENSTVQKIKALVSHACCVMVH